jgi:hypothetical protein
MEDKEKKWDEVGWMSDGCPQSSNLHSGNPRLEKPADYVIILLLSTIMSNFQDFLVECAMFPFPVPDETKSTGHIEISHS